MAAVLNIDSEHLLSSPNQAVAPTKEGPTEPGEAESLNGNPLPPNSSEVASGETSNARNVDHASVVETVHRVVQEVKTFIKFIQSNLYKNYLHKPVHQTVT